MRNREGGWELVFLGDLLVLVNGRAIEEVNINNGIKQVNPAAPLFLSLSFWVKCSHDQGGELGILQEVRDLRGATFLFTICEWKFSYLWGLCEEIIAYKCDS